MRVFLSTDHLKQAEAFVAEARAQGGLAPVDLGQFWADQEVACADPFGAHIPQTVFGAILNWECVFEEDIEWRLGLNRTYNDRAEEIVGRKLLDEALPPPRQWAPSVNCTNSLR